MKKMVTWGSPKEYQEGRLNPNSSPAKLPKTRSKYCKRLKGPHEYNKWVPVEFSFSKPGEMNGLWNRFCKACNRKDYWSAPDLPGPYWKIDKEARPPGYKEEK